ncbi:MAG TPA: MFS transporter [Candidatus Acidoferrum sp.]|jgi:MFS family permease
MTALEPAPPSTSFFGRIWPTNTTRAERSSLIAGGLGWLLDAMDVMLYSLVLAYLIREFSMSTRTAGLLNSLTLIASAIGGLLFGIVADRIGRTRSLMASILVYSLASAACGFAHSVPQLAIFRFLLGLGMGGEWSAAAALIAETWRPQHRGKALGLMQSSYAIGEAIAAGVVLFVLPHFGWRAVFFVGVLPALMVLWIRRDVPEPESWKRRAQSTSSTPRKSIFRVLSPKILRLGAIAATMNAFTLFGFWGLFTWIPAYLSLPIAQGGRGISFTKSTTFFLVLSAGKWLGYIVFGAVSDTYGRKKPYFIYLTLAAILVPIYGMVHTETLLFILGPIVAFFGAGYFSGYPAMAAEIYPGEVRATAMGFSYNAGRIFSATAPFIVGSLAVRHGIGPAFSLLAAAFFIAALLSLPLPESRGEPLD